MRSEPFGSDPPAGTGDPADDLPVGTMVGEYQIQGLLGEGGMGRVFKAIHPVIAKRAAIKVLLPELSVNRQAVERFVQEARAVNQIGHPNIVDIFAFGTLPDGRCYFVMEHLRGETLRERIARNLPSSAETLSILETITIALEAAHEKGIIHRDLKPDNVYLVETRAERPTVKLLDFGIAKLLGTDDMRAQRTQTGNALGTPAYMSPEQARGIDVDHRTDIYALGALAYEMLTGCLPFPATNAADMISQHLFQPPPQVRALNPTVPLQLDALVTRMLAKEASKRPTLIAITAQLRQLHGLVTDQDVEQSLSRQRAAAVGQGLVTTMASSPQVTPGPTYATVTPPPTSRRTWIAALLGLAVAGGAIAIVLSQRGAQPADGPAPRREPVIVTQPPPPPAVVPDPPAQPAVASDVEPELDAGVAADPVKPAAIDPKRRPTKPRSKPARPARPDDDDAPM